MTEVMSGHRFSPGSDGRGWMTRLEEMYDAGTFDYLRRLEVSRGWRCLEAGAGGGSVARWLSREVGPDGVVVALDRDTRFVAVGDCANVEVVEGDIDEIPVEAGAFDLVHARLLLEHLPKPEQTLAKLIDAVRPGGWILLEDMDWRGVCPATDEGADVFRRISAVQRASWSAGGYHATLGFRLPRLLREHGLIDVDCEARSRLIEGGTPRAATFIGDILRHFGRWYVSRGLLSADELEQGLNWVGNPECAGVSASLVATWGRRPVASATHNPKEGPVV